MATVQTRKIVVATTFREFAGTANDELQLLFLRSLKKQTHTDWICAITLFGEKNTGPTLEEEGIPHVLFDGDAKGERWSASELTRNAVEYALGIPGSIVVWTSGDVIYEPDLFENIVKTVDAGGPMTAGTTSPHIIYPTLEAYGKKSPKKYFWTGLDVIFFDARVFSSAKAQEGLRRFRSDGWGGSDYYVLPFLVAFAKPMVNIFHLNKLEKIENDRALTKETREFRTRTNVKNRAQVTALARFLGITKHTSEKEQRLWFLKFRSPALSLSWMRVYRPAVIGFRIHLLGLRYHLRRLVGLRDPWQRD
jgi:hypothetical protein